MNASELRQVDCGSPHDEVPDVPSDAVALFSRRSIRRYDSCPVPRPVITRVLRAGTAAPSAHNRQPWRFVVITDEECKGRLADAMAARLQADRSRDGDDPQIIRQDAERSKTRLV